jgi:hypothetical protein
MLFALAVTSSIPRDGEKRQNKSRNLELIPFVSFKMLTNLWQNPQTSET